MTEDNIEIGICNADGFRRLSPQASKAKAALFTKVIACFDF